MASRLIVNIKELVNIRAASGVLRGAELAQLPCIGDGWLLVEDKEIVSHGPMTEMPAALARQWERARSAGSARGHGQEGVQGDAQGTAQGAAHISDNAAMEAPVIDATGSFVLPAWCDSHTHLVYAGSREAEFVDKLKGLSYAEINARGGGILNSARMLQAATEDQLFAAAWKRLEELSRLGTGSIEIKSGYGLSTEGELKMLRVIKKLKERSSLSIKASFLGAHTYPTEFRDNHQGYIDRIIHEMLPVIAAERLADYIDVFCENGFFSPEETETICRAGMAHGLTPKIHANQLSLSGGVQVGVKLGALSVDHLEVMDEETIDILKNSPTIGTLLPTAAFFLRMPFQPARRLVDAGCAIAIASDYNPGSSPSGNMNLVVAMSCIQMRLLPEEAINAATLNGACAMDLGRLTGSLTPGKRADCIFTRPIPSLAYLPYAFGTDCIERVMIGGAFV